MTPAEARCLRGLVFNLQVWQEVDRRQDLLPCSADAEMEQPDL